ncbi:sulfite exporter TauE/SafE family protein [Lutibacter sp.]|uniref:sulfite exporter TauE/SafE family protein n=1 Tax=Lutibacter sp. TaxID=1925666 RepID=UPI001A270104|nr:sulfite exporter TauE/SafE family protein [Lutibacter sp.]MBI9042035.1 sulfite exporter TauE/SafE family protein [Lutibacter sp.]
MELLSFASDYGFLSLISLAFFSFVAGFIDAVVGGGGLIQLPALLINLPNTNIPTLFGTNKIAALSGTSISAVQYSKKIKFNYKVLAVIAFWAAIASFLGAKTVSYINANTLKPLILVILILIAVYTFIKKDLGSIQTKKLKFNKMIIYGSLIGLIIGFYDGFFGPGTGSFLVLAFVVVFGFEFVEASAYSKVINCVTNIFALIVFIKLDNYILELAILMAICNITGNIVGTKMALKRGNTFVRTIFLVIVTLMILRYGYDIFMEIF